MAAEREQHIQLTVIVLSLDLGVFRAFHFFSLALLQLRFFLESSPFAGRVSSHVSINPTIGS